MQPLGVWLRILFGRLSVFTSACLSCGAVAGFLAHPFGANHWLWFVFGSLLPMLPLMGYFSSTFALRRSIETWKKLKEDQVITDAQLRQLRRIAIDWYTITWYGASSLVQSQGLDVDDQSE